MSKAFSALLPFAARQEQHQRHLTLDALLRVVRASEGCIWERIIPALFNESSPLTIVLVSPHVEWHSAFLADRGSLLTQWATATSAVSYTEEIGQSVVDVLLYASMYSFIPVGIWKWLEKQPSLPPKCRGRAMGGDGNVIAYVRSMGDIKILKSYLLLVWSEWDPPWPNTLPETYALIREDFGGTKMSHHRKDLIKHLDRVLVQLNRGLGYLRQQKPRYYPTCFQQAKEGYRRIREVLLEVDRGTVRTRTRTPLGMIIHSVC